MKSNGQSPNGDRAKSSSVASDSVDRGIEQAVICSQQCRGRCCRYVTIRIARPNSESDWDEVRWWLCHEGISVVKDEDDWMVIVETRCQHLMSNNLCGTYPEHPNTCQDYDAKDCEYTGEVEFEVCLNSEDDLAGYLERRGLKRGVRIAQAIRRSQSTIVTNEHYSGRFARGLLPLVNQ